MGWGSEGTLPARCPCRPLSQSGCAHHAPPHPQGLSRAPQIREGRSQHLGEKAGAPPTLNMRPFGEAPQKTLQAMQAAPQRSPFLTRAQLLPGPPSLKKYAWASQA